MSPFIRKEPVARHSEYFEGVLQLRNPNQELLSWVRNQTKKDRRALISKEDEVPGGLDLYFTEQHYLQSLAKKLKERFSGEFKSNRRLQTVSHITSKELYRVTILFRTLKFKYGDVIESPSGKARVLSVGNQVQTQNLLSGRKERWPVDSVRNCVPIHMNE